MADGYLITDPSMLTEVTDLTREQRHVGQPIGVMESTAHPELCWEFLRYCLLHPDSGIPVYRPLMEKQLEEARAFLAGQITAREAASRNQKRMSIYMAEQG